MTINTVKYIIILIAKRHGGISCLHIKYIFFYAELNSPKRVPFYLFSQFCCSWCNILNKIHKLYTEVLCAYNHTERTWDTVNL
jgi:hypothetical protein